MRLNIKVSSAILHKEGEYEQLWETIKETVLDGHTDGLMLNRLTGDKNTYIPKNGMHNILFPDLDNANIK